MMSVKLLVLAVAVATCSAKPFYFSAVPELSFLRAGRSPHIAYGFGSGFASDIGGVKHSNSIGTSFQTGDGEAYGAGIGSTDGRIFANGIGYAQANPAPAPVAYRAYPYAATPYYTYPYNAGYNVGYNNGFNNYRSPLSYNNGNAIATAQNLGSLGQSLAQSQNTQFGSFATAANFQQPFRSGSPNGNFGSAISYAVNTGDGSIAKSITQTYDEQGAVKAAVAASENAGGARASTAHTIDQSGGEVQHSGATSIDGPGIQASHSHATNTGATGTFY